MNAHEVTVWQHRLQDLAEGLSKLTPDAFLAMRNGRDNISDGLDALAASFSYDLEDWKQFMHANPKPRQNWLPIDPAQLDAMEVQEIYYRLRENLADERWIDEALVEPFESGSLIAAIGKIANGLSVFELEVTPPARP